VYVWLAYATLSGDICGISWAWKFNPAEIFSDQSVGISYSAVVLYIGINKI